MLVSVNIRQAVCDYIKAAGGWVNLDELVIEFKLNRKDLRSQLTQMLVHKDYPNLKRSSKRKTGFMTYGHQRAIYTIKYKYEVK